MKKRLIYKLLVSTNLLLSVPMASLLASPISYADSGLFVVGASPVNVRREPSTSGEIVAQYSSGQVVEYDAIVEGDGYRWVSYIGGSGHRNYVAIGTADGSQSFGSLSGGETTTVSPARTGSLADVVGQWQNEVGEVITITADGRVPGVFVAGEEVYIAEHNGQLATNATTLSYDRATDVLTFAAGGLGGAGAGVAEMLRQITTYHRIAPSQEPKETPKSEASPSATSPSSSEPTKEAPTSSSSRASSSKRTSSSKSETATSESSRTELARESSKETSASMGNLASLARTKTAITERANPIRLIYKIVTGRQTMPSIGDLVAVLALVGLGVIALVAFLIRGQSRQ